MIEKEKANHIIAKAADFALAASKKGYNVRDRLFDYAYGYFAGSDATYDEVYNLILRAVYTVEAVLEDLWKEKLDNER